MTKNEFENRRLEAIQKMKQMNSQSTHKEPEPIKKPQPPNQTSVLSGLGLPFLDNLKSDGDMTLVLGLLLLLLSEKADKRLLFALVYILL
ncbi:MAG: hypothetical protein E7542_04965 [Ruminococcaceae bacterium]|nr:hypothetical protein [Oscillospiraceae bacterium]